MRYFIGDTETTGLGPTARNPNAPPKRVCEVALMEIDPKTLQSLGELGSIINPEAVIEEGAMQTHGITQEEAERHPTLSQYIHQELGGPFEGEITLIGYRVAFDLPLLKPFGNITRTFDLLPLAQALVPDADNHKLQTMREYFDLPGGDAHRAMGDVYTTHQLLKELLPKTRRTLAAHCATEKQIYLKMPWGSKAGQLIVNLPVGYKDWLLSLPDLDVNLRESIEVFARTDRRIPYVASRKFRK